MPSAIRDAISQTRPFASPAHEAAVGLILVADKIRRHLERVTLPFGITGQQYNVLRILRGGGKAGVPTLTIAERMVEQAPGITRLLDRLEEKALVRRERCAEDRRQVLCWVTPAGLRLLSSMDDAVLAADEAAVRALKPAERRALVRLLRKIVEHTD